MKKEKNKINSNTLIKKAANNLNNTTKSIKNKEFKEVYDFHRLNKVKEDLKRRERWDENSDNKKNNKLREPLNTGKKVLVLAERLEKKNAPCSLYKSTTENKPYFNKEQVFVIRKRVPYNYYHNYWLSKNDEDKIINKRFIRKELFALQNQFI